MKDLIKFLCPKYTISFQNLGYFLLGLLVLVIVAYMFYLIIRFLMCAVSSVAISIRDTKIKLKSKEKQKITQQNESNQFAIPSYADYRYKSFYFGLKPYFENICSSPIAFYKAELLCYEAFEHRKTLNFFFPFISYKTLPARKISKIEEKVKECDIKSNKIEK